MLMQSVYARKFQLVLTALLIALAPQLVLAQSTTFTYQGRLTDAGNPANGVYDLQFKLFDGANAQQGPTLTRDDVAVANGVFSVQLDFGNVFDGGARQLEIAVRPGASTGAFTVLSPRQPVTTTPYAIKSLNAVTANGLSGACVSCVTGTQIGSLPGNSGSYIQNTATTQATSNFSISGNGTAGGTLSGNTVNATTQFNLGGSRLLGAPGTANLFVGLGAGQANASGHSSSFFGKSAGAANTNGSQNSFFGAFAGAANTDGSANDFFGDLAGWSNTIGFQNAFFGNHSGEENTNGVLNSYFGNSAGRQSRGSQNAFFGTFAGESNSVGGGNSFFGAYAGRFFNSGDLNSFFGNAAGLGVITGLANTAIGYRATVGSTNLNHATAIGAYAFANCSYCLVLGSIAGVNEAQNTTKVGIGTTTPTDSLTVMTPGGSYGLLHTNGTISVGSYVGGSDTAGWYGTRSSHPLHFFAAGSGPRLTITTSGLVGIGTTAPDQLLSVNGGASKPGGGSWLNFSDERLKNIKGRYTVGLNAILQLQPIRYEYKADNALGLNSTGQHIGFSAQALQQVIPEAVTQNSKGYLLVNNDPILWTMLNAIKEQQALITEQQAQIDALKKLVCQSNPQADVCKVKE